MSEHSWDARWAWSSSSSSDIVHRMRSWESRSLKVSMLSASVTSFGRAFHRRVPSGKNPRWYAKVCMYGTWNWALPVFLLAGNCMMWSDARMSRPWTILYIMMCSGLTGVGPSLACLRLGRMRDSYVRVFTAVGALRRLRWRKARVPLAFLAVALTCGDQD